MTLVASIGGSAGAGKALGTPPNRVPIVSTGSEKAQHATAARQTAIKKPGQAGR